jgi:hypothetical protein
MTPATPERLRERRSEQRKLAILNAHKSRENEYWDFKLKQMEKVFITPPKASGNSYCGWFIKIFGK